jgi:hypothetical protein
MAKSTSLGAGGGKYQDMDIRPERRRWWKGLGEMIECSRDPITFARELYLSMFECIHCQTPYRVCSALTITYTTTPIA